MRENADQKNFSRSDVLFLGPFENMKMFCRKWKNGKYENEALVSNVGTQPWVFPDRGDFLK